MLLSYSRFFVVILMAAAVSGGCKRTANRFEGPKVDGFAGRLTHNGKPVSFPEGETVQLSVHHEKSTDRPWNFNIQSDGTFKLDFGMLIGKYSARLVRRKGPGGNRGGERWYTIPDGFTVEEGKTECNIELGPNWKP